MAMPHTLAVYVIKSIPGYVEIMQQVYGTPEVNLDRITDAIAAFEETLIEMLVAFMKTLTGEIPKLELPILPATGEDTPRPAPFR